MTKKIELLKKLYNEQKITQEGLLKAVQDDVITQEEYDWIIQNKL